MSLSSIMEVSGSPTGARRLALCSSSSMSVSDTSYFPESPARTPFPEEVVPAVSHGTVQETRFVGFVNTIGEAAAQDVQSSEDEDCSIVRQPCTPLELRDRPYGMKQPCTPADLLEGQPQTPPVPGPMTPVTPHDKRYPQLDQLVVNRLDEQDQKIDRLLSLWETTVSQISDMSNKIKATHEELHVKVESFQAIVLACAEAFKKEKQNGGGDDDCIRALKKGKNSSMSSSSSTHHDDESSSSASASFSTNTA